MSNEEAIEILDSFYECDEVYVAAQVAIKALRKYRQCEVKGKKALFHQWVTKMDTIPDSPLMGGAPGGQYSITLGIVEYEDGTVDMVLPIQIRFTDNLMKN